MPLVDSAARATIQYAPPWEERSRSWSMPEPAVPSMGLGPGSIVAARYMLLERIGWGGSATVYRADDLALEGRIALKVLHPALADDCVVTERFRREASSAGRLRHERIVRIHECGYLGTGTTSQWSTLQADRSKPSSNATVRSLLPVLLT